MALLTFRSPTQGSVIMFGEDAKQLLTALNLPESGEITTAELLALITRLEQVITVDKNANPVIWPQDLDSEHDENAPIQIHMAQRAVPLLQLMKRCLSATETIRWPA
jgi:hypothetical protein